MHECSMTECAVLHTFVPMDEGWQIRYLRHVETETGRSLSAIAKDAGLSPTTLTRPANSASHKHQVKLATLEAVQKATKIPFAPFQLDGESLDFRPRPASGEDAVKNGLVLDPGEEAPPGTALVPIYDVSASAGNGLIPDDYVPVTRMVAFAMEYLRVIVGVDPKHAAIITATGDSMAPTVGDGDFVLVDMTVTDFDREGIYVFFHDGAVHVKRVMRSSRTGYILAIPDNPRYREQEYFVQDVRMIGRVKFGGGVL